MEFSQRIAIEEDHPKLVEPETEDDAIVTFRTKDIKANKGELITRDEYRNSRKAKKDMKSACPLSYSVQTNRKENQWRMTLSMN